MASLAPAEKAPAGRPLKLGPSHERVDRKADRLSGHLSAPSEAAMPVCAACNAGSGPCAACGGGEGAGLLRRRVLPNSNSRPTIQAKLTVGEQIGRAHV